MIWAIVAGCGDDADSADASADGSITASPTRPCPDGWWETPAGCAPFSEGGRQDCPDGFAHFVGTAGCEPLGASCPDGPFPEDTGSSTLYVDPSSAAGGDGSRGNPFGDLSRALMRARPGSEVLVAKGIHAVGTLGVPPGVTLRGACAAETVIVVPSAGVQLFGGDATITDITVRNESHAIPIVTLGNPGTTRIVSVQIDGRAPPEDRTSSSFSAGVGALRAMGELVLERVRIRDKIVGVHPSGGVGGITLEQVDIEGVELGLYVLNVLGPTRVHDTFIAASEIAIGMSQHGPVEIERCFAGGVVALMPVGSSNTLRDVVFSSGDSTVMFDFPVVTFLPSGPSDLLMERVQVGPARNAAIHLEGPAEIVATGVSVQDIDGALAPPLEGFGWGSGIVVAAGASLTMTDFAVRRAALCGLHLAEGGEMDVSRGVVASSTIGACLSDPDYDVDRLTSEVHFVDNENNLDTRGLPVPEVDIMLLRP